MTRRLFILFLGCLLTVGTLGFTGCSKERKVDPKTYRKDEGADPLKVMNDMVPTKGENASSKKKK